MLRTLNRCTLPIGAHFKFLQEIRGMKKCRVNKSTISTEVFLGAEKFTIKIDSSLLGLIP
jgi:hypothetical protein